MIQSMTGNLLEDTAEAYVNTVNTVGVMGKGIALQFKQAFPEVFKQYAKDCKSGVVQAGKMHVVEVYGLANPRYIINFPTKQHWRNPSKLEYIKTWMLANAISMLEMDGSSGPTPEELAMHGIDMYFLLNAMIQGKPIVELEGTKAQVDMFEALSPEAQEQSLVEVLDSILEPSQESEADVMQEWFSSWKKGDVSTFAESLKEMEGVDSEYNSMLFGKRDEAMAEKITSLLEEKEGTYFVVVGAGHFLVDKNIRYHLEQDGYTVDPLY